MRIGHKIMLIQFPRFTQHRNPAGSPVNPAKYRKNPADFQHNPAKTSNIPAIQSILRPNCETLIFKGGKL